MVARTTFSWRPIVLTALAAILTACDLQPRSGGTGVDNPVVQVIVSPDTATLDPSETHLFRAFGRTAAGDSVPVSVRWTASAGTVTSSGMYTADTSAADVTLTASLSSPAVSGTAKVRKRRLVQIVITPKDTTVPAGGARLFTVYGRKNTGEIVNVSVNYSATGGTVSGSGMYSAGLAPGFYRVIAKQSGGSLADTAAVTVESVPVASVAVSPLTASVTVGQTQQLTATPMDASGNPLSGRVVTWTSQAPAVATVSASGLVTAVAAGVATVTAGSEGQSGSAVVTVTDAPPPPPPPLPPPAAPSTVTDLAVTGMTDNSVTLSFTEVSDGTGLPASYDIRWAVGALSWASATEVVQGTCAVPVTGTAIGAGRSCTVQGLGAGTAYQFQMVAFRGTLNVDAVFGNLSNVANGTTAPSTAPVASVTLSPGTATVAVGATRQFTATVKDAAGNTLSGRTVTWTSSAPLLASVSGSGLVAGLVVGTATISATSEGQSGAATVTVSALPPPPPPPSGWPNEPSGFTVIQETGWESGTLESWYKIFESADKPITVESITDSPSGESKALQIGYPAGHRGGGGTELRYRPPVVQYSELFVGYYVQVSSQWQGHSSGINKMLYLHDGGSSFAAMWYEIFGSGSNPLDLYVVNQSGGSPSSMRENVNQITFERGRWHKVEIYQKQGSPGIVRVWVDGVLAIDRSDVYTQSRPVDNITISGIWGGVGEYKDHFDYMRFDRIRISGR